jgi:hypothetical protein
MWVDDPGLHFGSVGGPTSPGDGQMVLWIVWIRQPANMNYLDCCRHVTPKNNGVGTVACRVLGSGAVHGELGAKRIQRERWGKL